MPKRKTHEQFEKEVFEIYNDEYLILDKYVSAKVKLRTVHKKCGKIYLATPHHFVKGVGCSHCNGTHRRTTNQFVNEIYKIVGSEYKVLGEYENANKKIEFRHEKCGNVFHTKPSNFLRGSRCPKCARNAEKTTDSYKGEIFDLVQGEYSVLSEYENAKTKMTFSHRACGKEFEMLPSKFLHGDRCPHCFESKGETAIRRYLERNSIPYEKQYTFDDCVYKDKLRFDFYIPLNDKKTPFLLLEYNGAQHYKPVDLFGGADAFKVQKTRDEIKTQYCISKGIPLLIIAYSDFKEIENILNKKLSVYGLINKKE